MNSALKLKMKPTAQRYAGGGVASLLKKHAKQKVPSYADGTTTYQTNIPEAAMGAYQDLIGQAQQLTDPNAQPYQQYQGQRQAQFTPLQQQSYAGIGGMQTNQYSQQAGGLAGLYAGQAGNLSYDPSSFSTYGSGPQQVSAGAGPQQTSTTSFTQPGTADQYMNPYMQSVVDTQKREAVRSDDIARTGRNAQAVGAGAFGGSRQAIMESEANRNLQQRLGDIQTTGSDAAFKQAQQQFNTEQGLGLQSQLGNQSAALTYGGQNLQAGLGNQNAALTYGNQFLDAQRLGEASKQFGATYGLQGLQTGIQGATAQGNLGQNLFNQQSDIYGLQNTAGSQQQQNTQAGLDQKYADYQQQKNYPYQQLGFMSDILRGTQGTTSSVYTQQPQASNLQNIIGLGTALSGLGKAKGGSIEGGLASIAPSSVGDFADGGIVGYASKGSVEGDDEEYMPEDYRDSSVGSGVGGAYSATRLSDKAIRAARSVAEDASTLSKYGTDAQTVVKSTKAPGMFGKVVKKAGPAAALAATGYDVYNTPLEQYEDRFAFEHDPDRGLAGKAGIYALGAASDLGRTLTGGLVDPLYRDLQNKKAPKQAAAAPAPGEKELAPIEKQPPADGSGGLASLIGAGNVSAGPAPTVAGVQRQMDEAGIGAGLDQYQRDATAQSTQLADTQRAVAQKYQQGLKDMFATQGIVGEHRRAGIEREQAGLPQEEADMKNNALLRAGLSILAAPPGGGAFAAIARGALPALEAYGVDKDKFMKRKGMLDESMNKLLDAQQAERGLRGKALLDAQANTDQVEVEAQKRFGDIVGMVSKAKNVDNKQALFTSFSRQFADWKNHEFEATKSNAANRMRLGIAQFQLGAGAGGGGKPMTAAQRVTAVNAAADDIQKANPAMKRDEVLRQAADFVERYQRPGAVTPGARTGYSMDVTD